MHSLWRLWFATFKNSFWVWEIIFKFVEIQVEVRWFCWLRLFFFYLPKWSFNCTLNCLPRVWGRLSLWRLLHIVISKRDCFAWSFCHLRPFRLFQLKEIISRGSQARNIDHHWGLREFFYLTLLLFNSSFNLRAGLAELRSLPLHSLRANRLIACQGFVSSLVFYWFWVDFWWRLLTLRLL